MVRTACYVLGFAFFCGFLLWLAPMVIPSDEVDLNRAHVDLQQMAIKATLIRVVVLGLIGIFFWEQVSKLVLRFTSLDISFIQVRVICWYVGIEAMLLASFWRGF